MLNINFGIMTFTMIRSYKSFKGSVAIFMFMGSSG